MTMSNKSCTQERLQYTGSFTFCDKLNDFVKRYNSLKTGEKQTAL